MDEARRGREPSAWMVRGGREGEREREALKEGLVIVGWSELGDIGGFGTWDQLRGEVGRVYPTSSKNVIGNWTGQLWRFAREIQEGDLVVAPLKVRPGKLAVGRVTGPYEYRREEPEGFRQVRTVEWIRTDIAHEAIRPDLRASMGSLLTVCRLSRNDAARRIAYLAEHGSDPGVDGDEEVTSAEELLTEAVSRNPADPRKLTIRSLLEHWGMERRTGAVVATVKADLAAKGMTTRPPFTEGAVGDEVSLVPLGAEPGAGVADDIEDTEDVSEPQHMALRLGNLPATLVSIPDTATLQQAKTLMIKWQFSQIAVVGGDNTFQGVISWESIGRAHVASVESSLRDAIAPAVVIDHDALLLDQIDAIYSKGYVFVRNADRQRVTGIITAADLTRQFGNLARPFVLIEEAESRIRRAAEEFSLEELRDAVQPSRRSRVHQAADFMFGDYIFLLKDEKRWKKLNWKIDQNILIELLEEVRKVRNELMHFAPDPLSHRHFAAVHGLLELLRTVDPRP